MKRIACLALMLSVIYGGAMAQSAGSLITSVGGTWLSFGSSSSTPLQSTSAAGTFSSPGTGGQIHNTFTAELALTYFITDNIALDLATGVPPKLNFYSQGTAAPFGQGGPTLAFGDLKPLASTRAWPPILFVKYYFGAAQARLRPFVGIGVNYTWFSHTDLNPTFNAALQQVAWTGRPCQGFAEPVMEPCVQCRGIL